MRLMTKCCQIGELFFVKVDREGEFGYNPTAVVARSFCCWVESRICESLLRMVFGESGCCNTGAFRFE